MRLPGQKRLLELQAASRAWCGRTTLVCVLLAVVTLGVYWPVISNGFINYDDGDYVTENAQVQRGLSWDGLVWAFGSLHSEHTYWHPLTWVSHMVDYEAFGLKAWGHHLVNLLFHTINTVLVFLVFRRMTGAFWRCAVLAGLFALHPLQVDTVAQVAERKNLLSAGFWLLTMWAYARYVQQSKVRSPKSAAAYGVTLLLFGCGLMCKPVLVTLPFVLLLLDYWPLNRFELETQDTRLKTLLPLVREKLPFFALAAVSSLITIMAHRGLGMLDAASGPSLELRIENAAVSYVRYLGSTIWPSNLAVFYPYPAAWPAWKAVSSGLLLLGVSGLALRTARRSPYLVVGWFWFLGVMVPFIGLIQAGLQAMADRFAYVPLLGLFLAGVWGARELAVRWRCQGVALAGVAVAAVLVCAALTRRQIGYWKDGESLWRHALAATQNHDVAHHNLGCALADKGLFDEAIPHYQDAIRINPARSDSHSALAYAFTRQQRFAEAIGEYEETLHWNPGDAEAHNNLGSLLLKQERVEEAIQHYSEALKLNPADPEPHANLALAWVSCGHYLEAAAQLREVIRLNPNDTTARQRLDGVLAAQEKLERATGPQREGPGTK
jgi:tetratricopeptide (TPR) repeat protein